jgi:hypothetical protein
MTIYVAKDGQRLGPYSIDQLKEMLNTGKISMADQVWVEGNRSWRRLCDAPELVAQIIPPIPQAIPAENPAVMHPSFPPGPPSAGMGPTSAKTQSQRKGRSRIALFVGSFIGGFIIIYIALALFSGGGESVEQFRDRLIATENQALTRPDNAITKKIEGAHVTVTVTGAMVSSCQIYTVDGTGKAGKNDSNISEVDIIYTVNWDGVFQKNGFTEFELDYDYLNRKVKGTKYLRSSALINLDNVNWAEVGADLAVLIGS